MYTKAFAGFVIILSLWTCVSEIQLSKPTNPALFVTQLHLAFVDNNTYQLNNIMIDKDALIVTLTEENNETVYAYDAHLFTMATDSQTYNAYKRKLHNSFLTIKDKSLNWKKTNIQKATYQTDSLQISIKGFFVVKDNKNRIDSIHFKGVKLLDIWALTELH